MPDTTIFPYRETYSDVLQNFIPTPFITVSAQNPITGEWLNFDAEFDTGATITVLPRSAARSLGIDLTSGYQLTLVGVGGARIVSYVHPLMIKLNGNPLEIYVAFATIEIPPLLGRFTLFDQVSEIDLKNESAVTLFANMQQKPLPKIPWTFQAQTQGTQPANWPLAAAALISPIVILGLLFGMK